ncbi:MAG TPA: hypothetical protein VG675_21450 [Bryobacteraceae bacterium]|nr:hypothetical protein [Bryobacteraceae bacterium]
MHGGPTKHVISIWFFIGVLLIVYGFLILGQGMWELFVPPAHAVILENLHIDLWWGALMLIVGGVLTGRSAPW